MATLTQAKQSLAAKRREAEEREVQQEQERLTRQAERERNDAEVRRLAAAQDEAERGVAHLAPTVVIDCEGIRVTVTLGHRDGVDQQVALEAVRIASNRTTRWFRDTTVNNARAAARGGIRLWPHTSLFETLADELRYSISRGLTKIEQVRKS